MKSSNLAQRMDVGAGGEETRQAPASEAMARPDSGTRRRARFEYRAFDERVIVIRDHGLRPFRVR